jgi:hypothetical protein
MSYDDVRLIEASERLRLRLGSKVVQRRNETKPKQRQWIKKGQTLYIVVEQ